ncbi:hypothetical protein [Variovorax sp. LG9.2]|uniref:hypothetical protein n=1 Tax=Variovorax sp. LG9.2 TaxID=3048626 RepID=UPI002B22C610|nr:hypothetical protein [Variovorax sp. LG9.2]MEB0059240.1 hypothetical protein [Variovorax sp. LG9.2]
MAGAPEGNSNAVSHGIYRKRLSPEEQVEHDSLNLGAVDHELRLTRIMVGRALAAEAAAAGQPELEEVMENDGGGAAVPSESRRRKVRDYHAIIDKLIGRIESLEKTRLALGTGAEVPDFGNDLTRGVGDEPGPPNPVL